MIMIMIFQATKAKLQPYNLRALVRAEPLEG